MIEAQSKVWSITPEIEPKAFIEQDKAPAILRRMIDQKLRKEMLEATSAA